MPKVLRLPLDAFNAFVADEGWAIASHIALSMLMALFPFLIFVTALAGFIGFRDLSDEAANMLLDTWPDAVAIPLAREIHNVLTTARGDVLTVGVLLAIFFASSGVESLRIALNRAYGVEEKRQWWLLRLESIAYVLVGALALLAFAFLIVLGPLLFETARALMPWLDTLEATLTLARYGVTLALLVAALVIAHKWLPSGRRSLRDIAPGIAVTLGLWFAAGMMFGRYLAEFASSYVTTYAGLASAMIALVFLYWTSSIFVYGGEINALILDRRRRRQAPPAPAPDAA